MAHLVFWHKRELHYAPQQMALVALQSSQSSKRELMCQRMKMAGAQRSKAHDQLRASIVQILGWCKSVLLFHWNGQSDAH